MGTSWLSRLYTSSRKYWVKILALLGLFSLVIVTRSNYKNTLNYTMIYTDNTNTSQQGCPECFSYDVQRGDNFRRPQPLCKTECRHVVFIKVHKAASTTTMNVMLRFALKRNLAIMLPTKLNIISEGGSFTSKNILPSKSGKYDILCNHVIYDRQAISKYFPSETKYVTILREPFDQFTSGFMFYRDVFPVSYLIRIPGSSPISTYLENQQKYEPKRLTDSFTNNRMSVDLGINRKTLSNKTLINEFVKNISNDFDLVLIAEYYDESMILLKRTLNWNLEDVFYMSSNIFSNYKNNFNVTALDRERFRQWAKADYALYQHFHDVFWQKIRNQGSDFFHEVRMFRSLRKTMSDFCTQKNHKEKMTTLKATEWSRDIIIDRIMCEFMMKKEIPIMTEIKKKYFEHKKIRV